MFKFVTSILNVKFTPLTVVVNFTFLIFFFTLTQVTHSFYCTESFCEVKTSPYDSPCGEVSNCTKIGYRTFLDPEVCNCCEYCFDYLEEDDTCSPSSHKKPAEMCGPHLTCTVENLESDHYTCQKIVSPPKGYEGTETYCMERRYQYEQDVEAGTVGIAQMNPVCDAGGNYAPRQCLSGSVCYCSNLKGNRIFGLALPNEYQDCACARDVDRLKEFGFTGKFPHCLPNGDYDELQCVVETRTCFCRSHAETLYAMHDMKLMPCFNSTIHRYDEETPLYYIRGCELDLARDEVQIADAKLDNTTKIIADMPKCDPDGNYAPIQTDFNRLYCAAPNGSQIETYEAEKFSAAATQMNCHCARARMLLTNSATGKPVCCSNGNYKPWQCVGSTCFCVDQLGRQICKTQVHIEDRHTLPCYNNCGNNEGNEPECNYDYKYDCKPVEECSTENLELH